MPDLDNPKNLENTATVVEDFAQVGNQFKGYIKLNGVKWKAISDSCPYKSGTVVKTTSLNGLIYKVEKQN